MNNLEIPCFYIGQEIIAKITSRNGLWKRGDEFVVKAIKRNCCEWVVDIGIKCPTPDMKCGICYGPSYKADHFWSSSCFAPKIEIRDFISLKEVSEKAMELVSAN